MGGREVGDLVQPSIFCRQRQGASEQPLQPPEHLREGAVPSGVHDPEVPEVVPAGGRVAQRELHSATPARAFQCQEGVGRGQQEIAEPGFL